MAAVLHPDGTLEVTSPPKKQYKTVNQSGSVATQPAQSAAPSGIYDLAVQKAGSKPTYQGSYENQLNDIYDKIANREKFNYDVNADPLYQTYKDQYIQQGKLAMKDTMGQAAALTGGYGNTYGQQVGQQAYNSYLQNLSAVIPELYGMAYSQYQDEGNQLKDLYRMLGQRADTEYNRYRDEVSDWNQNLSRITEGIQYDETKATEAEKEAYNRRMAAEAIAREIAETEWNHAKYEDETEYNRRMAAQEIERQMEAQQYERDKYIEERDYNREKYAEERDYQKERDTISDQQRQEEFDYKKEQDALAAAERKAEIARTEKKDAYTKLYNTILKSGYRPTAQELLEAGMTEEEADALYREYQRNVEADNLRLEIARGDYNTGGGGSSYGGGGSSYGGGGSSSSSSGSSVQDPYGPDVQQNSTQDSSQPDFHVDENGDIVFNGTQDEYINLSEETRAAVDRAVDAQERGKKRTEQIKAEEEARRQAEEEQAKKLPMSVKRAQ